MTKQINSSQSEFEKPRQIGIMINDADYLRLGRAAALRGVSKNQFFKNAVIWYLENLSHKFDQSCGSLDTQMLAREAESAVRPSIGASQRKFETVEDLMAHWIKRLEMLQKARRGAEAAI